MLRGHLAELVPTTSSVYLSHCQLLPSSLVLTQFRFEEGRLDLQRVPRGRLD